MTHIPDYNSNTEVTLVEWERRKEFVGFTDRDAQLLAELRPIFQENADEVVEELYRQFARFEETKAFFPDEATLNRVKTLQKEYFLGLTGGKYGEEYLLNRLHIGMVHQTIGLSPRWYMGAYSIYAQLVTAHILKASKSNSQKAQSALLALTKIIALDQELATTTYIAAREAVIAAQSREILEISTPVVQIWDGVVAAPLIGTFDSRRTQQLMEKLLTTIVETKSSVALVDITGVPAIDTMTAQYLVETISAVRLLGSQVVLTGVSPPIAQSLVHLGIELRDIITRSSLSAGLRVALDILGKQVAGKDQNQ